MSADGLADRQERDGLLDRLVRGLEAAPSVTAVWLGGSLGRGNADDFSDLDLWIVVEDKDLPAIVADTSAFVRAIAPTIMEIHAPSNAPPGGAYLLTWIDGTFGPQQVDWYWQPETGAVRPAQSRLLFERQPIPLEPLRVRLSAEEMDRALADAVRDSLLMAFIAAKHAQRGDPWTTTGQIMRVAACLGRVEWLLDHSTSPSFDDRANISLPAGIPATAAAQSTWLRDALGRTLSRLHAERPGFIDAFEDAVRSVERWLDG